MKLSSVKLVIRHIVFFTVLYLIFFPPQAHAYLDPGTGSYILQILGAFIFAGLFLLKTWWVQIKRMVYRLIGKHDKNGKDTKKSEKEPTQNR